MKCQISQRLALEKRVNCLTEYNIGNFTLNSVHTTYGIERGLSSKKCSKKWRKSQIEKRPIENPPSGFNIYTKWDENYQNRILCCLFEYKYQITCLCYVCQWLSKINYHLLVKYNLKSTITSLRNVLLLYSWNMISDCCHLTNFFFVWKTGNQSIRHTCL